MELFCSLYSSTMILTGMTVERCITLTHPLTMSRPQSAMYRAKLISLAVWLLASLCSIPQVNIGLQSEKMCQKKIQPDL
jgi:hypothetical protein